MRRNANNKNVRQQSSPLTKNPVTGNDRCERPDVTDIVTIHGYAAPGEPSRAVLTERCIAAIHVGLSPDTNAP